MKKRLIIFAIIVIAILAVEVAMVKEPIGTGIETSVGASYRDATYIIDGQKVVLKKGVAKIDNGVIRYFGNEAWGDLNGDGKDDVAFLLTQDNDGSGTFYYVTVALAGENNFQGLNTILLGDRIAPQNTAVGGGKIIVNYADRTKGESMTTEPSVGISKYFKVIGGVLTEIK